ncbi:ROK family protein [Microbacterium sp.]|uniref:ROK family protein n=1 Tax=Microbacterium sp. TaxID=51671 RepID=UPI003A857CFF
MNGSVRDRNLARLLRLVHVGGPLSRAQLTEATGLNRSTIGDLVSRLERAGMVREAAPTVTAGRVGRPSPVVAASPHVVAIAVNPEVDAVEFAVVGLDRSIRDRVRVEQDEPPSPEAVAALIGERVAAWSSDSLRECTVSGIGVAVPGMVSIGDGVVRDAPHLRWRDVRLQSLLAADTGLPVVVDNDATLGMLAEHLFGAARGYAHAVYLNGGASGIGGGLVVAGNVVRGTGGFAGEFGQNRPGVIDPADRCSVDGVLEDEVSRARLLADAGLVHADDARLATALRRSGDSPEVGRQRRVLATAIANAVNVLNPAVAVVGGFLATLVGADLDGFEDAVRAQAMPSNAADVRVRLAELAEDRLLMGAAEYVFETQLLAG